MRETIGRLLQAHSDLPPTTAGLTKERHTIPALRRERLREALSRFGASVAAESVAVVADGLGTGHLAVTDTAVYLINDGGTRIKAECKCKSGSGGCVFKVAGSNAACLPGGDKPCQKCGFILGLTVPRSQLVDLADDLGSLGQDFLDQLPDGLAETAHDLARLDYPLADRVALRDQLKVRGLEVSSALMPIVFPIFSLADALDKLFAGTTGNLMRWAVGDYEPNTVRNLAFALSAGAIQADESSRELTVVTIAKDNGVVVDVSCSCAKGSGTCYLGTMPDLGGSSALDAGVSRWWSKFQPPSSSSSRSCARWTDWAPGS